MVQEMVKHVYIQDEEIVKIDYKTDLCYSPEWLNANDCPGWQVELNTGQMVYEDDGRPDYVPSAWERLAYHCSQTEDFIVNMWIRFRDHVECVGSDKEGFFLYKEVRAAPNWDKEVFLYIAGFYEDGVIKCKKWKLPEIIVDEEEEREAPGGITQVLGLPALIRKKDVSTEVSQRDRNEQE
jgi:hypothetical protein